MSYYFSKHPGLFTYILLIAVSVLSFLYFDPTPSMIGVLSVFWGMYICMRVLSLYELSEHFDLFSSQKLSSKTSNYSLAKLPKDLAHRAVAPENLKRSAFALLCVHARTMVWLALALIYAAYYIHSSSAQLSQYDLVANIAVFFMIGAAFWAGQSYAYSNRASRILFAFFGVLSALCLYHAAPLIDLQSLLALQNAPLKVQTLILALLLAYTAFTLIYSITRGARNTLSILLGLTLLAALSLLYFSLSETQQNTALWICGWGFFSLFWIRVYSMSQKRYVLYQCE